ncbi:MAG: ATP-binding protein [Alphaproteobacteria bacterium]|nr:ATP-binding protein [Alphaproteobacteria bacterium]
MAPRLLELGKLLGRVDAFGVEMGFSPEDAYRVVLVLDELITNIIVHGVEASEVRHIVVDLHYRQPDLEMEISDPGRPFDPRAVSPPDTDKGIAERKIGGLGIHVVRTLVDSIDYRYDAGRNVVTLVKRLSRAG